VEAKAALPAAHPAARQEAQQEALQVAPKADPEDQLEAASAVQEFGQPTAEAATMAVVRRSHTELEGVHL